MNKLSAAQLKVELQKTLTFGAKGILSGNSPLKVSDLKPRGDRTREFKYFGVGVSDPNKKEQ